MVEKNKIEKSLTTNGDVCYATSGKKCLDYFFAAGASRGKDISDMFLEAFRENQDLAVRITLWMRDARGGAGERQQFKNIISTIEKDLPEAGKDLIPRILDKVPELGRWDDILVVKKKHYFRKVGRMVSHALLNEHNGLCAKWMPRKGRDAARLRNFLKLDAKGYRKLLVSLSNTVEQQMSAKKYSEIEYKKVPSLSHIRYRKAFGRNDTERYAEYINRVSAGVEKINTASADPHLLVQKYLTDIQARSYIWGDKIALVEDPTIEAMWKTIQVNIGGSALPVFDSSGSMFCHIPGSTVRVVDVAAGLSLYISEKIQGPMQGFVMGFNSEARLDYIDPNMSLLERCLQLKKMPWGMNTSIASMYSSLLDTMIKTGAQFAPDKIIILSDMQFDRCIDKEYTYTSGKTSYEIFKERFQEAGFEIPQVIFWSLSSNGGKTPVSLKDEGTALVSGFSPSILKVVLESKKITPMSIMLNAVGKKRYDY